MPRGNTEIKEIFRGRTLTNGAVTRFSPEFPLGEGWVRMMLKLNLAVTIGTGTTPLSENGLRFLRSITFRTDRSEFPVNAVPARALARWETLLRGTGNIQPSIPASTATTSINLDIWFQDPLAIKPEDTVLNTARYSAVTLEVTCGTVADLFGTVGTSSVVPTLDCQVERTRGPLPAKVRPLLFLEYGVRTPIDPTSSQVIDFERASNLAYKRFLIFACNTTTVVGVPFSGDAGNLMLTDVTVDHDGGRPFETLLFPMQQANNKMDYSLEVAASALAGLNMDGTNIHDYVRDGSLQSMLYSGDKSRLRYLWTNGTLGSTPQVNAAYMATRPLI